MKTDKSKTYFLELLLIGIISFLAIFQLKFISKIVISIILIIYSIIVIKLLNKRQIISINSKDVLIIMTIFSIVYLGIYYVIGIFTGYYKAIFSFTPWTIKNYIIPLTIIIIASELIRFVFLSQKVKSTKTLTLISMILIDLLIYSGNYNLNNLNDFLGLLGFVTFSSISTNLLYNYISIRYGVKPVIIYRLITTLYLYIIPITPDVYIFFKTLFRMIYPYVIYTTLEYTFSKGKPNALEKQSKSKTIGTVITAIVSILIVALVSNQFKYGLLVIATGSMTGTINKGDAVLFKKYNNRKLNIGEIIIFHKENKEIVHRIIDIKVENGKNHYYTKGDANQQEDDFYVLTEEIVGTTKLKIPKIGYPTLWLRDLFKK